MWPFPSPAVAARHDSSLTNRVIEIGGVVLRWPELGQDKTEGRPPDALFIRSILEGCCLINNRNWESTCIILEEVNDWLSYILRQFPMSDLPKSLNRTPSLKPLWMPRHCFDWSRYMSCTFSSSFTKCYVNRDIFIYQNNRWVFWFFVMGRLEDGCLSPRIIRI